MMQKKWRAVASAALALGMAGMLTAGCGGSRHGELNTSKANDKAKISLNFFGNKTEAENVKVIDSVLSEFMQQHSNIHIAYESLKGNAYFDALQKRLDKTCGDDVFFINHDLYLALQNKKQLAELQNLASIKQLDKHLLQTTAEGKLFWVPTTVSAFGLYCNEDLLQKHNQKVPQNLNEWRQVNAYFVSKGITPIIANNDISLKTLAIGTSFYPYYRDHKNMELFSALEKGNVKLSSTLKPGFDLVAEFLSKGYVDKIAALQTEKTKDDLNEFVKGQAPFMLTGAWAVNRVKAKKPSFKFSVHPLPILEHGAILVVNADTRLAVNSKAKDVNAATAFVNFFCRPENLEKFCKEQVSFNPNINGKSLDIPEVESLQKAYTAKLYAVGSDDNLQLPIWSITRQASVELLKGMALEQVLANMDKAVEAFQSKNK